MTPVDETLLLPAQLPRTMRIAGPMTIQLNGICTFTEASAVEPVAHVEIGEIVTDAAGWLGSAALTRSVITGTGSGVGPREMMATLAPSRAAFVTWI